MATPPLSARPPATPAEERRLRKLAASRHAPASWIQRARIITASWDGATVTQVAQSVGCHPKTVSKWLHRFNAAGLEGLADLPRPGAPRRLTEHERGRIIQLARTQPPGRLHQGGDGLLAPAQPQAPAHWTLDTLTEAAQAEGIRVGRSQVRQILLAEGARWRNTRSWTQAPTRTSSQKSHGHRLLHRPAAGRDRGLRRRTRPGHPAQLPTGTGLDAGRPPRQGPAGLRPRAGAGPGWTARCAWPTATR
jgi:transposase